ncbi:MAG TPA: tRNA (guanosine(46)-N7)-methyltransferase TrmB [Gammaproteobacteria bacterium]|nr:tRNA (guanosine(46)-N7)-methyltransferase TrmB [Gammaproteobacteria bacterium]
MTHPTTQPNAPRRIRSFVRREGRITPGQRHALETLLPRHGLSLDDDRLDLATLFPHAQAITLEIGFGNGESLAEMAERDPSRGFIGVEVHRPGVGHLLQQIQQRQLNNLRVVCEDALDVLRQMIPPASLDTVQLFFPDPWPKKRHHKRRIVNPEFLALVASRLKPGGRFHMATDWEDYAASALALLNATPEFRNLADNKGYIPRPANRPETRFERRGQRLAHGVWDLLFARRTSPREDTD